MRAPAGMLLVIAMAAGACSTADFAIDLPGGTHGGLPVPVGRFPDATPRPTGTPSIDGFVSNGDIAVGTYTGSGTDATIDVGFAPALVLVQLENGLAGGDNSGVIRLRYMTGAKRISDTAAVVSNSMITSLSATGFTVDANVLTNGATCGTDPCRYHFIAIADHGSLAAAGTYMGNGCSSVGSYPPGATYTPKAAIFVPAGTGPVTSRTLDFTSVGAVRADAGGYETEWLQGLSTLADGGVTAGQLGCETFAQYHYFSLTAFPARIKVGSYTGSGASALLTGVGFAPDAVLVQGVISTSAVYFRSTFMPSALSVALDGNAATDAIEGLDADGFGVGANAGVNSNGGKYYYLAFKASD